MKKPGLILLLFLAGISPALAVKIGDTYDQVVAEKGLPTGTMEVGEVTLLNYPGQSIRLEHGKVALVKTVSSAQRNPPASKPAPVAPPVAAAKKQPEPPTPADLTWVTDYASALTEAKAQNRHVFLFFTGSDWCGWCKRLDREILSTAEFSRYASENLILVKLDFPRGFTLPAELGAQNKLLARRYSVEGYPTVIVLDSAGRAVKRLGYQEGGPAPFVGTLAQLQ